MNSPKYKEWVETLKEGNLVLLLENNAIYSAPVIFLAWNGDSASSGYRSQHLWIPDWNRYHYHFSGKDPDGDLAKQWNDTFAELEKHGTKSRRFEISVCNANADKRYFPFPKEFLSKNQKKFLKIINKIKGYEY